MSQYTSPQPSRRVRRKGAAPLNGAEKQTARAISAYAQCAFFLSLQMGSINLTRLNWDEHEQKKKNTTEAHEYKPSDIEVFEKEDKACPALWSKLSRRFGTAMVKKSALIAFYSMCYCTLGPMYMVQLRCY